MKIDSPRQPKAKKQISRIRKLLNTQITHTTIHTTQTIYTKQEENEIGNTKQEIYKEKTI